MYRKNVALRCRCRIPTPDSSAVGIAQLVAHTANESILCVKGGNAALTNFL